MCFGTQRLSQVARGALFICAVLQTERLSAQRPAATGAQVSPSAVGAAAPTAAPIGGLRTTPISSRQSRETLRGPARGSVMNGSQNGTLILTVPDAPLVYGVVPEHIVPSRLPAPETFWFPTADPPTFRIDTTVSRVDAWRDLIVTDMVCNGVAVCMQREQHIKARWAASCGCYAFVDGWNRVWRVE